MARLDFNVEAIEAVTLDGPPGIAARDLMSPYVWRGQDHRYQMMVRAVPRPGEWGDTGTIWHATSDDGRHFTAADRPAIVPGPEPEDAGGCEDPTVVERPDGSYVVYYTGVDIGRTHGEMLYAEGPSMDRLAKRGVAMPSTPSEGNIKEATVDRTRDGGWRMFYEYAANDASLIGLAIGEDVAGPWTHQRQPFAPRPDSWDAWHLSTGPLLTSDKDRPVMFYNGATHDARWRIGWIAFDADYAHVVDRCIEPLIAPPPAEDRSATDIVFAASIVLVGGHPWLYYSRADAALFRASLRRS
ncbi:glycosidase [Sphingomonas sp.]|uniref:glycoside hydrolase family 130 protein n=1 Tax=Sphingomonas sp. TaxID=28214 RepID=UPI001B1FA090|nr:glycosidase [Sphingomonas sp.]MBO9713269.1 glycosidase [Sphingomonas sp.]